MRPDDFADIDTKTPSGARVYDYMLGGTDNYVVDRIAAEQAEQMMPGTKALARNNRRYVERVVRYLAGECGIRQFIDNGSGLPTRNNVHHIAQAITPESRVVYIDIDPVVLRHQRVSALAENENTAFVLADATDVDEILAHPETRRLIRPDEPTAVLYLTFLHFVPDDADPWGMVHRMLGHLVPGSYLAVSQIVSDDPEIRDRMTEFALRNTKGNFGRFRRKQEVRAFFDGLEVVDPGLVDVNEWHPDGHEEQQSTSWIEFGGVAQKVG
jgi:hypothetical protein